MGLSTDLINRLRFALTSQSAADELTAAVDNNTNLADGKFLIGDVNGVQAEKTLSGDLTSTRDGVTTIGDQKLDGRHAKNVGTAGDVIGGLTLTHIVTIADASADTDVVLTHKSRVIKFEYLNTGIGAHATLDTVQLKNGATAITDAVAKTAAVNALVKAATYDPAQVTIAAAGTLRITAVKNTNVAGIAIITVVRSA